MVSYIHLYLIQCMCALNRKQEDRKERQCQKSGGLLPLSIPEEVDPPQTEDFKVDEYKDMMKGSFDTGDPLTTNLYVGNINPKVQLTYM